MSALPACMCMSNVPFRGQKRAPESFGTGMKDFYRLPCGC